MNRVPRIEKIEPTAFTATYIAAGRPVIVTDAMTEWPAKYKWTPEYFRDRFGALLAQVYDNLFTIRDIRPLGNYIDQCFGKEGRDASGLYVRWYAQFKHIDLCWSDAVFSALARDWSHPYFLPVSAYVLPLCRYPETLHAPTTTFPYKGIFISACGARTRLHRDPFGTDAVLCQFYGTKSLTVYAPADDGKPALWEKSSWIHRARTGICFPISPPLCRFITTSWDPVRYSLFQMAGFMMSFL